MQGLGAHQIAGMVRQRRAKAQAVMCDFLDRTERLEPRLNSYAWLDAEGALAAAAEIDRRVDAGEDPGPLAGVPVSVKDLIAVAGLPLTFGSRQFAHNVAAQDAPSVQRVRAAGGCIVGKTTTSELGSKAVGDSPLTGTTANPWRAGYTSGGSSAGAAAGVAAGLVPLALGTDGGGSIRIPASFCGLVGIKGSFGRVPVWPASATPGLAHVAPLARTAREAILLFDAIAGSHASDPASMQLTSWHWREIRGATPGLRIGWCEDFEYGWADPEVKAATRQAAQVLCAALGTQPQHWAGLREDPAFAWSTEFYAGIAARLGVAEAARADVEAQLDPLLARQIQHVRALGDQGRRDAQLQRARCAREIQGIFERFDLLLMPATPVTAFPAGRNAPAAYPGTGAVEWSYFTYPFNLSGNPAASFPVGLSCAGLPIGLQLVVRIGAEELLFNALLALEAALPTPRLTEPQTASALLP